MNHRFIATFEFDCSEKGLSEAAQLDEGIIDGSGVNRVLISIDRVIPPLFQVNNQFSYESPAAYLTEENINV